MERKGAVQAWASASLAKAGEHLRISQFGIGAFDETELDFAPEPIRLPPPIATASQGLLAARRDEGPQRDLEQSYQRSLKTIDEHIFSMAAAITALDTIELQLTKARSQIEHLRERGEPINVRKAETTLLNLAEHINHAVKRIDLHNVNLMRDSRIELRVVELDTDGTRVMGFDLTLISLEKLLAFKLRSSPMSADALCGLIDAMQQTVNSNLHILSSMVLMMFASRDYTDDVAKLVLDTSLEAQDRPAGAIPARQTPNLKIVQDTPAAPTGQAVAADPWRRSLMTLLERTQAKAAE